MTPDGDLRPAEPRVTVSLVTYEGRAWLAGCLASLAAQRLADYELIVHDNASVDGSAELVAQRARLDPRIRSTRSARNIGYTAPHDRAIAEARGAYVLLLNQDVELDPGFLSAGVDALEHDARVAAVQGRIRRLAAPGQRLDVLDTTGLRMGRDRRAFSRGHGRPDGPEHAIPGPVWGVDGPAPLYRRSALLDARLPRGDGTWEVLDRDFFMQKEDVDLAWRLRSLGWEAWYEPRALAWHARGTGDSGATGWRAIVRANRAIPSEARALSWRNQRLMQIKNEEPARFLRDLPWIASRELLTLAYLAVVDPRALKAVTALLRAAPAAFRKRRRLRARVRRASPPSRRGSRSRSAD